MRVNRLLMPFIFIVTLMGTIFIAQAAGLWSVSGRTTVDVDTLTVADIKGWMTLQQIIDGIGISKQELYTLAHIPDDVATTTALKDIEKMVPGFETSALRDALLGRTENAGASQSIEPQPIEPTVTVVPTNSPNNSETISTPLSTAAILPASQIKGSLTLQQVSEQCAVPLDAILRELKLPLDTQTTVSIKTLVEQGILSEITQVRDAVARLQEK